MEKPKGKGLVHIYYGQGKGKTTAALGALIRAAGHNLRVGFFQFIKSKPTGELKILENIDCVDYFRIENSSNRSGFITGKPTKEDKDRATKMLEDINRVYNSSNYDLVILDEALAAVSLGLFSVERLVEIVKNKPEKLELIITGRGRPGILVELADYVTEMKEVKHPFFKGLPARKGIEF